MDGVRDADQAKTTRLEDEWGVDDEGSSSSELDGKGKGEVTPREVEWGDGDEVGGTGKGEATQLEVG